MCACVVCFVCACVCVCVQAHVAGVMYVWVVTTSKSVFRFVVMLLVISFLQIHNNKRHENTSN